MRKDEALALVAEKQLCLVYSEYHSIWLCGSFDGHIGESFTWIIDGELHGCIGQGKTPEGAVEKYCQAYGDSI